MQKINIAFFPKNSDITVLEHLRILGPVSYTDLNPIICHKHMQGLLKVLEEVKLIVVQRDFPNDYKFLKFLLQKSKELNTPIVYDLDDYLFGLPWEHPDRQSHAFANALMPMLEAALSADYLTVSNNYLKDSLSGLNQNIFVLPNFLDERIWMLESPKKKDLDKTITICYMGSSSHKPDIEFIGKVLADIKEEYFEKLRLHFYGAKPPEYLLSFPDTLWTPIKTYQYDKFAKDFQQLDVDIFIAPLIDNKFNRCKSPIKFFEYSSMGVPGIFSRIVPYQEIITDGENGLLASSLKEWDQKIRLMIENPDVRHNLASNAQNLIKEKFLLSQNSYLWTETYKEIINLGKSNKNQNNVSLELIKGLVPQLLDYHESNQEIIKNITTNLDRTKLELNTYKNMTSELENKVKQLQIKVEDLKQEVLFYALSKSWYVTRPLRKIGNGIKKLFSNNIKDSTAKR
jgi:glycosyltransferase involved in cell wall biosynthesis